MPNIQQFIPGKTDRVWETKKQEKQTKTLHTHKCKALKLPSAAFIKS